METDNRIDIAIKAAGELNPSPMFHANLMAKINELEAAKLNSKLIKEKQREDYLPLLFIFLPLSILIALDLYSERPRLPILWNTIKEFNISAPSTSILNGVSSIYIILGIVLLGLIGLDLLLNKKVKQKMFFFLC